LELDRWPPKGIEGALVIRSQPLRAEFAMVFMIVLRTEKEELVGRFSKAESVVEGITNERAAKGKAERGWG
jgi:hypothetical protein